MPRPLRPPPRNRRRRPSRSALLEADLAGLRLDALADRDGQDAVLQVGLDLVRVGDRGEREAAGEAAVLALVEVVRLALLLLLGLAAARDGEHAVLHRDVEVLLLHAGEIGVEHEVVAGLLDLEARRE